MYLDLVLFTQTGKLCLLLREIKSDGESSGRRISDRMFREDLFVKVIYKLRPKDWKESECKERRGNSIVGKGNRF